MCLSDFIAPKETKLKDNMGAFVVTTGIGMEKWIELFEKDHDDYSSILLKALCDRLAEAFAECIHEYVRTDYWGYSNEKLSNEEREKLKQEIPPAFAKRERTSSSVRPSARSLLSIAPL